MYTLPDVTTPWHSTDEMSAAMMERDHRGRKRYEHDPAFQQAVMAKCNLGTRVGGYPTQATPRDTGVTRVIDGRVEYMGREQFFSAEGEIALRGQLAELKLQLAEEEARHEATTFMEAIHLRKRVNLDPTQPVKPFATRDEQTQAIHSSEYKNDPTIRAHVEARVMVTDFPAGE